MYFLLAHQNLAHKGAILGMIGRLLSIIHGDFIAIAQAAGAVAVLVTDNTDGPLVLMNSRGQRCDDITIPAVFIAKADGNLIKDMVEGQLASFGRVCGAIPITWEV